MRIEKVRIKKTLKAGPQVWLEGAVLTPPLPPDILKEVDNQTGTVEVLESSHTCSMSQRPVVQEPVFKDSYKNDPLPRTATTVDVRRGKPAVRRVRRVPR